jgi:hypothetical protein
VEVGLGKAPAISPGAWASLVRDYLLRIVAAPTKQQTTKAKKKKKKKKKKKANAATDGDEAFVAAPSEEATASADAPVSEPAETPLPAATVASAPAEQEEARDQEASVAAPTDAMTPPPTWESQRFQRRLDWVDRYLDHYRQQPPSSAASSADDDEDAPPLPTPDEIGERLDPFLAWLSQTPDHVATASPGGNLRNPPGGASAPTDVTLFRGSELQEAVQLIECLDCRQRVQSCLDSNVVLAGTQTANYQISTNQYIAMEEGTSKVLPPQALVLVAPEGPSGFWKVERTDGTPVVWNRDVLEFWLREYLILGGLGYDHVVVGPTGMSLTEEQEMSIWNNIDDADSSHVDALKDIADHLQSQAVKLTTLKQCETVDFKSNRALMDIEETLSHIMQKILDHVNDISRSYQEVALYRNCASRRSEYPAIVLNSQRLSDDNAICNLWDAYLNGVTRVFLLTSKFEEKMVSMVDNAGNFPHFYYNSASRQLFKQFLNQKLLVIHGVLEAVDKALASDVDDRIETVSDIFTPTFLRSIFALKDVVVALVPDHPTRRTPLDDACEDMLYRLRSWCEKIHKPSETQLWKEHEEKRKNLVFTIEKADTIIRMAITDILRGSVGDPSIELMYRQWQTRDIDAVRIEDVASLRQVHELVVHKAGAMIRLWMNLRAFGAVKPSYPSKRVGISASLVSYTAVGSTSSHSNHSRVECLNGAESRAGCILSSLLFDWMSRRFGEWQAEMAERELLTVTDIDGASWSKVAKGKNTKKKKEQKAVVSTKPKSSSKVKEEVVDVLASRDGEMSDDELPLAKIVSIESADEGAGKEPLPLPTAEPRSFPEESNVSEKAPSEVPKPGVGKTVKSDVVPEPKPSKLGPEASLGDTDHPPDPSPQLSPKASSEEDIARDAKGSSVPAAASVSVNGLDKLKELPEAAGQDSESVSAHLTSPSDNRAVLAKKDTPSASYLDLECNTEKGVFDEVGSQSPAEFLLGRYLEIVKLTEKGVDVVKIQ